MPERKLSSLPLRRRRVAAAMALFAVLVVATVPASGPSAAQSDSDLPEAKQREILDDTLERAPQSAPSPDDLFEELRLTEVDRDEAAMERLEATSQAEAANVQAFNAALAQNTAQKAFDAITVRRDFAQRDLEDEKDRLSDLTVHAYVSGGSEAMEGYRAYVSGDTTDVEGGRQLLFSQVLERQQRVTRQSERALARATSDLAQITSVLELTEAFAADRTEHAQRTGAARIEAERRHEQAIADVAAAQGALRAAGRRGFVLVPQDIALIGLPRLTAEDLAGWFRQSPYRPRIPTPIEDFARWFIDEGQTEGIRGDIAFAQAVLETGGFANNDSVHANNYSGIGHCDTCGSGWRFPSPQMGVRAQIQLLKSYALASPRYVHPKVDSRLRGPAGCCPTWGELTTVWATDPTYGPKVMLIYSDIVAYALSRRAAGQGFDDPRVPLPMP